MKIINTIYDLTLTVLKDKARECKIQGFSTKRKKQLADLILEKANVKCLKSIAKLLNIKGYYKLKKKELIDNLKYSKEELKEYERRNKKVHKRINKGLEKLKKLEEDLKNKRANVDIEGEYIDNEDEYLDVDFDIEEIPVNERFVKLKKAFKNKMATYSDVLPNILIDSDDDVITSYNTYLSNVYEPSIYKINELLNDRNSIKVNIILTLRFIRIEEIDNEIVRTEINFSTRSKVMTLNRGVNFDDELKEKHDKFITTINSLPGPSSLVFDRVLGYHISIVNYTPFVGGTYKPTPVKLKNNKSILNIQNTDNYCFIYCDLASRFPAKDHKNRVTNYSNKLKTHINPETFKKIKFPIERKDYPVYERLNNVKINVFLYSNDGQISKFYVNHEDPQNATNMLLIGDVLNGEVGHHVLINDFNKLNFTVNNHKCKKYYCMRCCSFFNDQEKLNKHIEDCKPIEKNEACKLVLPNKPNNIIQFLNHKNKNTVPYVIYADFECIISKKEGPKCNPNGSYTEKVAEHIPCGYGYYVVSTNADYESKYYSFRGENAHDEFMKSILKTEKELLKEINVYPEHLTKEEKQVMDFSMRCCVCEKIMGNRTSKAGKVIRDAYPNYCHMTGKFFGASHGKCNMNFKNKPFIPVIMHNLKGYDAHIILQVASKYTQNISCIPQNHEKYVTFNVNNMKFIDSLQFLNSSLDSLVKNLTPEQYINMGQHYKGEQLKLLLKKGVYPYEWVDTFDKFNVQELPDIKSFYSSLTKSDISKENYQHALNIWEKFNIKDMGEYHDLYLKTDVLLLADVFETFRKTSMNYYKLDPCHYLTSPALSWDAMLLMTEVNLELLTDIDMYNMIEKGIRGGISYINHRHAIANNIYMKAYDPQKESSYIVYLDANNLYGWAMSQDLPTGGFEWVDDETIKIMNNPEKFKKWINEIGYEDDGYILEVDIEYPQELHDLHSDYPLAIEKRFVNINEISEYQKNTLNKLMKNPKLTKVEKLVPTLENKTKYVVDYRNLKYYMDKGLKVTKVHRIISYVQQPFLKEYIDFNSNLRAGKIINKDGTETIKKVSNFEKDFFKLMNNSVYGKTMENVKNRINGDLCANEKKLKKKVNSPLFKCATIFNENLALVEHYRKVVELNKPIYIGFTVLDLSKLHMYKFHYDYVMKKYESSEKAKLLFTDTDSLTYHIKTEDVYQDMAKNSDLFDFSDYPQENIVSMYDEKEDKIIDYPITDEKGNPLSYLYDKNNNIRTVINDKNANIKVVGKFKDETMSKVITEFVGIRSKMYAIKTDSYEKKTAKGIGRSTKEKDIKFQNYLDAINPANNGIQQYITQNAFKIDHHQIYSIEQKKKSFNAFDDKKYILDDGITTLSYGHYKINKNNLIK
jgi:hypothetical protein